MASETIELIGIIITAIVGPIIVILLTYWLNKRGAEQNPTSTGTSPENTDNNQNKSNEQPTNKITKNLSKKKIVAIITIITIILVCMTAFFANYTQPTIISPPDDTPTSTPTLMPSPTSTPTLMPTPTFSPPPTSKPTATPTPSPYIAPTATPPPPQPSITIATPANNAPVNMYEWISGTSQNIPADRHLWIIIRVDEKYFAHEVLTINANGRWEHDTQIGQENEGGKRFDVMVVLANSSAHTTLRDWRDKQNTAQQYDLTSLPVGVTQYSAISVTRRNTSDEIFVTITSPANNSAVGMIEWVSGKSQNIPAGQQLWIVVHEGSLYFPMFDRVQINTDGIWRYSTTIGKDDDEGKSFEIIAVLANSSAQAAIQAWYQNPYDLHSLPAGMTRYSAVTVTRL